MNTKHRSFLLSLAASACYLVSPASDSVAHPDTSSDAVQVQQDPAEPMMRVTDSARDLEKQLGKYLSEAKGWAVSYRVNASDPDDLFLDVAFDADPIPTIQFAIDAVPSARSESGVTETVITIKTWFTWGITADHAARPDILEVINRFTDDYWMPHCVFLDSDGDLAMESAVNIPGKDYPVHAEQVADCIVRSVGSWRELFDRLEAAECPLPKGH